MTQPKLRCPHCGEYDSKVTDSRPKGEIYWRRRRCDACRQRFSTRETVYLEPLKPKP